MRLSVPEEWLDDELEAESTFPTRGMDVVGVTIDVINTASAVVSVVVGVEAFRRYVTRLVKRRRAGQDLIELSARDGAGTCESITVDLRDADATDQLLAFIEKLLSDPGA